MDSSVIVISSSDEEDLDDSVDSQNNSVLWVEGLNVDGTGNPGDLSVIEVPPTPKNNKLMSLDLEKGKDGVHIESDVEILEYGNINTPRCPVSFQKFSSPVRNNQCGHVYEKWAIMIYIAQRKYIKERKCPTAGCCKKVYPEELEKVHIDDANSYAKLKLSENSEGQPVPAFPSDFYQMVPNLGPEVQEVPDLPLGQVSGPGPEVQEGP